MTAASTDRLVRGVDQAPDYPLQLMIGVVDFPARAVDGEQPAVPDVTLSHVRGRPLTTA